MKKVGWFLFYVGLILLGITYFEGRYGVISAYITWDMTEEEKKAFVEDLRQGMLEGQKNIELEYIGSEDDIEDYVVGAISEAFAIDKEDTSSDFDYMRYIHSASHVSMTGWGRRYKVTYTMEYLESYEQTNKTDKMIAKVLKKLNLTKKSDYEKIKAVHDYVINNTSYDMSTELNSPYYALVEKTSACQGYAVLIYKMLTELDVPCRVITGNAKNGLHAWNIVKLDGKWYNLDATWDDPIGLFGKSSMRYNYFLKTDNDMVDHQRDEEFRTTAFYEAYPMAKESY
ncbi:MAG: hypothetical protein K2N51_15905 [Lachnospiraceae bacterium]|nr:hypothetical protein [Lachnospiraceae bacterium]